MGWLFSHPTRQSLVDQIIPSYIKEGTYLKHWYTQFSRQLWIAIDHKQHGKGIVLFLLKKSGNLWGYKVIDECSTPYYFDCPLAALAMTNAFNNNPEALSWRQLVFEYHNKKALTRISK